MRSTACCWRPQQEAEPGQHRRPASGTGQGDLLSTAKLDKEHKDGVKSIIPAKALTLLDKLIDDPEEPVGVQVRENQVIFHTSNATRRATSSKDSSHRSRM